MGKAFAHDDAVIKINTSIMLIKMFLTFSNLHFSAERRGAASVLNQCINEMQVLQIMTEISTPLFSRKLVRSSWSKK